MKIAWWTCVTLIGVGFIAIMMGFAIWVDSNAPRQAPLPAGCMVVDFNTSKGADYRMVCRNESHPVPMEK